MKIKKMKQKITALVIVFEALLFIFPSNTSADGLSLKVSPSLFRLEAKQPADIWAPFTIENQSNQPVSLQVGYRAIDPENSSNGNVVFLKSDQQVPGPDKAIFQKIQVVDSNNTLLSSINLGPKQKQTLRVHIALPTQEPTSDYYFTLIFLENTPQTDQTASNKNTENQKSASTLQGGIGINVFLAIGNKESPQASINNFTTQPFYESGPVIFNLNVYNSGQHFLVPHGEILIKNMFGQTVGKVTIPPSVILSGTSRTLFSTNHEVTANTNSLMDQQFAKSNPLLVWPERFLFGAYDAKLTLFVSDQGPIYTRCVQFFAFPVRFLLGVGISIVVLYAIYLRVKKKIT